MSLLAVTWATGFVGRALVARLASENRAALAIVRHADARVPGAAQHRVVPGLETDRTAWKEALHGVSMVVHIAARAHLMREAAADPLAEFRRLSLNMDGTLNLAQQAVAVGVQRFVFVSSIGVNGVQSASSKACSGTAKPNLHNAYALSKWEAEQGLFRVADETGMGSSSSARLWFMAAVRRVTLAPSCARYSAAGPLPLGVVHNQRSLVALDNLVDFIITCITYPQAANQTFLVSDGQDLSTTELVRGIAQAAGVSVRLLPVPVWALQAGATLLGRDDAVQRLCGNLQVDMSKARSLLGWVPPVSVEEGLRRAMAL